MKPKLSFFFALVCGLFLITTAVPAQGIAASPNATLFSANLSCTLDGILFINAIAPAFATSTDTNSTAVSNLAYDNQGRVIAFDSTVKLGSQQTVKNIAYSRQGKIVSYTSTSVNHETPVDISNILYDNQGKVISYNYRDRNGSVPVNAIIYSNDGLVTAYTTAADRSLFSLSNIAFDEQGRIASYDTRDHSGKTQTVTGFTYNDRGEIISYNVVDHKSKALCLETLPAPAAIINAPSILTVAQTSSSHSRQALKQLSSPPARLPAPASSPATSAPESAGPRPPETDIHLLGSVLRNSNPPVASAISSPYQVNNTQDLQIYAQKAVIADDNIEAITITDAQLRVGYRQQTKLLGFIPLDMTYKVSLNVRGDDSGKVQVELPWWRFLATAPSEKAIAEEIETQLANSADLAALNPQPEPPGPNARVKAQLLTTLLVSLKSR